MTIDRSPRGSKQKESRTGDKKKTPVERARSIEAMRVRACVRARDGVLRECARHATASNTAVFSTSSLLRALAADAREKEAAAVVQESSSKISGNHACSSAVGWLVLSFSQPPASGQLHAFQLWGLFSPRRRRRDVDLKLRLGGYRASRRRLSLSLTKLSSDAGIVGFLPGLHAQPTPPLGLPCTSALLVGAARMRDRVGDLVSGVRANCRHRRRRNTRRRREISDFPF